MLFVTEADIALQLGDPREPVRVRIQQIIQTLPKVYAYSRVFQLLLDYGLKSKVAKTRQGTLDELGGLLKRFGMGTCEPAKAFPVLASMIADKDAQVRKSALGAIGYDEFDLKNNELPDSSLFIAKGIVLLGTKYGHSLVP